jgi:hypothetical protein
MFATRAEFEDHMHKTHSELVSMLSVIEFTSVKRAEQKHTVRCLLCKAAMSLRSLQKHLASHQQQLALFALPSNLVEDHEKGDEDSLEEIASSLDMSENDSHERLGDRSASERELSDKEESSSKKITEVLATAENNNDVSIHTEGQIESELLAKTTGEIEAILSDVRAAIPMRQQSDHERITAEHDLVVGPIEQMRDTVEALRSETGDKAVTDQASKSGPWDEPPLWIPTKKGKKKGPAASNVSPPPAELYPELPPPKEKDDFHAAEEGMRFGREREMQDDTRSDRVESITSQQEARIERQNPKAEATGVVPVPLPGYESISMRSSVLPVPAVNTVEEKGMELPSISEVHARNPVDVWYDARYAPKHATASERLPNLSHSQPHANSSSDPSSALSKVEMPLLTRAERDEKAVEAERKAEEAARFDRFERISLSQQEAELEKEKIKARIAEEAMIAKRQSDAEKLKCLEEVILAQKDEQLKREAVADLDLRNEDGEEVAEKRRAAATARERLDAAKLAREEAETRGRQIWAKFDGTISTGDGASNKLPAQGGKSYISHTSGPFGSASEKEENAVAQFSGEGLSRTN